MTRTHHDLLAWQQGISLVRSVYQLTRSFPPSELYALTNQMHRAAISIPANIAEGMGRESKKELVHFLTMARGSLSELDTYLVLAKELGYCTDAAEVQAIADRAFALIGGLINSNRRSTRTA